MMSFGFYLASRADGRSENLRGQSVIQCLLMEQVLLLIQSKYVCGGGGAIVPCVPKDSDGPEWKFASNSHPMHNTLKNIFLAWLAYICKNKKKKARQKNGTFKMTFHFYAEYFRNWTI